MPSLARGAVAMAHGVRAGGRLSSLLDDPRARVRVPLRLLVSIVAAAAALGVVEVLEAALGFPLLFPAFVVIVFVSAQVAGTAYGVVTMALFGVGYTFFYLEPRGAFGLLSPHALAVLGAYTISGLIVTCIGGAVRKAYARLRDEHRAVTAAHEQRENLLKALTHDIRTPLSVITTSAALLARETTDPAAVLRRAQAIRKSAATVADMLSDLIDTAQLESGHLPLERSPVDLARFLVELEGRLEGTLPLDRVRSSIPEGLPAADVDPRRFERVLVNLLSNALKYAPPPTPIVVSAAVEEGQLVLSVADRGPGISPQDLPHIFDKYYRAQGAREIEGLGVGLYATQLLVQAHGGRIWVDSVPGQGTTFHVAVPAVPAVKRAMNRPDRAPASR